VGKDFGRERFDWLKMHGFDTRQINVAPCETTRFLLTKRNGSRKMRIISKCDPLYVPDISQFDSCDAVHFGPISDEIPEGLALRVAKADATVSLDPQGYLRRVTFAGKVQAAHWFDKHLLKTIDVLKVSEDELDLMFRNRLSRISVTKLGPDIVLLTKGKRGTLVWSRSHGFHQIPSYPTIVRDSTGAGDALIGAFLVTLHRTGELVWSACVGSAVASFAVEQYGPAGLESAKRIETRAQNIFEHTRKVR